MSPALLPMQNFSKPLSSGILRVGVFNFALVVQEYRDVTVAFKSRYRIYDDFLHFRITFLLRIDDGREYM